jgi:predicted dehydrogenase
VPRPEIKVDASRQAHRDPMAFSIDYHLRETEELLAALDAGRAPAVSSEEGRRAAALVLAIYRSADEGRRVELL